jgi:hypothetical protein
MILYDSNITTINMNGSCIACGCYAKEKNYSGFNCFANNIICSMFPTYSVRYGLSTTENATFYFFELPSIGKREREREYEKQRHFNLILFLFFKRRI